MKLRRIIEGDYETSDGKFRIMRMEHTRTWHLYERIDGELEEADYTRYMTLRDARAALEKLTKSPATGEH